MNSQEDASIERGPMSLTKTLCQSGAAGLMSLFILHAVIGGPEARGTPSAKTPEITSKPSPPPQPGNAAVATKVPETDTVGIHLYDLRDLSPAKGTFTCDFWIWSRSAITENVLSQLQFVNAERIVWYAEATPEAKGVTCFRRRGTGIFRANWNLKGYPYDAQTLSIVMEYSLKDASRVALVPDMANSGVSTNNFPSGWKLTGFSLRPEKAVVESNLGDPGMESGRGEFSRLVAMVDVSRADTAEYWGLVSSACVAAIMVFMSFFIELDKPAPRFALLGAAFFATVISLRAALAGLGTFGTRVDELHLVVMGYIIAALVCTLILNHLHHKKADPHQLRNYSAAAAGVALVSFVLIAFLLMHRAVGV